MGFLEKGKAEAEFAIGGEQIGDEKENLRRRRT
jgi:hypothetical protein